MPITWAIPWQTSNGKQTRKGWVFCTNTSSGVLRQLLECRRQYFAVTCCDPKYNLEQKIRYKLWLMAFQFNLENRRLHFCNQLGDIHVDKWHSNRRWNWGQFCKFVAPFPIIFCALSVWIHKQTHSIFVDRHNTYILSLTSPKISNNQQ